MLSTTNHFNQFKMQTTPSVSIVYTNHPVSTYVHFIPIHAVSMFSLSFVEQCEFSMLSTLSSFYNFTSLF